MWLFKRKPKAVDAYKVIKELFIQRQGGFPRSEYLEERERILKALKQNPCSSSVAVFAKVALWFDAEGFDVVPIPGGFRISIPD